MRREMRPGDQVAVTLAGATHAFGPDVVRIQVDETSTRSGARVRYATVIISLSDEFPETTDHVTVP